jgi:hypothetical protein
MTAESLKNSAGLVSQNDDTQGTEEVPANTNKEKYEKMHWEELLDH